jgi:hypothetical protein
MNQFDPALLVGAGQPADLDQDVDMTPAYDSSALMPTSSALGAAAPEGVSPSALVSPPTGERPLKGLETNPATKGQSTSTSSAPSRKPSSSAATRLEHNDAAAYAEGNDGLLVMEPESPAAVARPGSKPAPKRKESATGGMSPAAAAKERERLLAKTREQCRESIRTVVVPLLGEEQAPTFARELEELIWTAEDGGSEKGRKKYLSVPPAVPHFQTWRLLS